VYTAVRRHPGGSKEDLVANQVADICLVGAGHVGGLLAKELASAGLKVVALERGPEATLEDYAARDAIDFVVRRNLSDWIRHDPVSFRNVPGERASLRYGNTPLNVLGGATLHWTGQSARFLPGDFKVFSNEIATGVAERAGADLTGYDVVDWPLTYDDLEPYYTRFEWEFGVSGRGGGNPFAGPRSRDYPLPPLRTSAKDELFEVAAKKLGYHPYKSAAGILSQAYRPAAPYDSRIAERPGCVYCGHCNGYGCHVQAKAAALYTVIPVALATGNVDLRTNSKVFRLNADERGRVTGVSYFDPEGQVREQRARVVILAGYVFENTRLLLLAGLANSSGLVGKGLAGHGDIAVAGVFDDYVVNAFIGPQSGGARMDDFNGNTFDHAGLGFIRGGAMGAGGTGTPIEAFDVVPPDVPLWGSAYKEYLARYYTRTLRIGITPETLPHQDNIIDLDPELRDAWGIPIPRVTFTFHQNETRMQRFLAEVGEGIMRETGADKVWTRMPGRAGTRWVGGTRMGSDARTSVVNGYGQSHDMPNLFVAGASLFPTITAYPATATISALAYRTAEYLVQQREMFR
jgi:gluconate 2-dehydrogenase alpha chain